MSDFKVIVLDTEATGTDPAKDQIIEAAYLAMRGTPADVIYNDQSGNLKFRQLYKPNSPMTFGAQATHNILMSDLDGMPHPVTFGLPEGVKYIIGHNIDFDMSMIGEPPLGVGSIKRICTLALSRYLVPETDSHKQSAMLYLFASQEDDIAGMGRCDSQRDMRERLKEAHSALADVENCTTLLQYLLLLAKDRGLLDEETCTWDDVYALSELARIPIRMGFGKHAGDLIADVPSSYVQWYMRQSSTDPYYVAAFRKAGLTR